MGEMPTRISFLLVSGFMMASYVLATDALRLANWRDGRRLFRWDVRTPDNAPAEANNGMIVIPDTLLDATPRPHAVFICAGFSPEHGCSKIVFSWLRTLDRQGAVLGGWDTGPLILAEAGLMDGRRMALHWQAAPAVHERYPLIEISSNSCEIDKRRFTGPGGVSTFDLIIAYIEQEAGPLVAQMVVKSANGDVTPIVKDRILPFFTFGRRELPQLARAVSIMEEKIRFSPSVPAIAAECGLSERGLYRLFRGHLCVSPKQFYLTLRLQYAHDLLRQSDISIAEIAAMTGFNSSSRFSQIFRQVFAESPTSARSHPRWLQVGRGSRKQKRMIRTDQS
jgi:AraC family carnitine catabolism transcriptional activator